MLRDHVDLAPMPTYTIKESENVWKKAQPDPPMTDFMYRQCEHGTRAGTCKQCDSARRKATYKHRKATCPEFRLMRTLRSRAHALLKRAGLMKRSKHSRLFGAPVKKVKAYLEAKFKEGMSWSNWGFGPDKWHIDHIMPLSSFDLTVPGEIERAFHYTNLQPLWQRENLAKGNRLP